MATARAHQAIDALPTSSSPSSTRPRPLLVVGSINQDVVLKVSRLPSPGETLAASSMEFFPGGKVRRRGDFVFGCFSRSALSSSSDKNKNKTKSPTSALFLSLSLSFSHL